jgi:hypothetical protein
MRREGHRSHIGGTQRWIKNLIMQEIIANQTKIWNRKYRIEKLCTFPQSALSLTTPRAALSIPLQVLPNLERRLWTFLASRYYPVRSLFYKEQPTFSENCLLFQCPKEAWEGGTILGFHLKKGADKGIASFRSQLLNLADAFASTRSIRLENLMQALSLVFPNVTMEMIQQTVDSNLIIAIKPWYTDKKKKTRSEYEPESIVQFLSEHPQVNCQQAEKILSILKFVPVEE